MDQDTPSFVWDRRLTKAELRDALVDPSHPEHDALLSLLLREARPDRVWAWTSPEHVAEHLERIAPRLGRRRAFWEWLFEGWRRLGLVG
ncbi:MAG: hypothetical protein AAF928_06695 [Myxococcota bacterium]